MTYTRGDALREMAAEAGLQTGQPLPGGRDNGDRPSTPPLRWLTAPELAALTPEQPDWLVEGQVAREAISEVTARIKAGKTTFSLAQARAITTGEPFMGCATKRTAIVYLTEERPASFRDALSRVELLDCPDFHVLLRQDATDLSWPEIVAEAVRRAEAVGAELIVTDTLGDWASLVGEEENTSGAAMEAMRPLQAAAAGGLAIEIARHGRKSGGELGDAGRGSSAFGGAVDILLQLERANTPGHESRRVLKAVGRFDGIAPTTVIEWRDGVYVSLGDAVDVEQATTRRAILDILPGFDAEPWIETHLLEQLTKGNEDKPPVRSTVKRALDDLVTAQLVAKLSGYGRTKRAWGYRLTVQGSPPQGGETPTGQSSQWDSRGNEVSSPRTPEQLIAPPENRLKV